MNDDEIESIRRRAELLSNSESIGRNRLASVDVPALISEVGRLQDQVLKLREQLRIENLIEETQRLLRERGPESCSASSS